MYSPKRAAIKHEILVQGLRYHVYTWGEQEAKPLFLLHGWMDVGMSFQALADAMSPDWFLIAPDWRGFGNTEWQNGGYWFPDYYADLNLLISHFSPGQNANLVGHSMGGHIAWMYAGIFPEQVSNAISLDAIGLEDTSPIEAPQRYRTWLEQCNQAPGFAKYADIQKIEAQIQKLAPEIHIDYANFIAKHWSKVNDKGELLMRADPAHKKVNPVLYRREEARSCWRNITAKVAIVFGKNSVSYQKYYERDGFQDDCRSCFKKLPEATIENAGHMLHWEQPERLAGVLKTLLEDES